MKQLKMSHTALVHFCHAVKVPLDKVGAFHRLDNSWLPLVVRGLQVFQDQRAMQVSLFQLRIDSRQPTKEVVSRIAWLVILREI